MGFPLIELMNLICVEEDEGAGSGTAGAGAGTGAGTAGAGAGTGSGTCQRLSSQDHCNRLIIRRDTHHILNSSIMQVHALLHINWDTSHMVMSWATLALPSALAHSASTGGKTLL